MSSSPKLPDRFQGTEWEPPDLRGEEAVLRLGPPEAILAALRPVLGEERAARIDRVAAARLCGLTVVLENLYDPHNGGAALRSCEGAGVLAVHVVEAGERFRVSPRVTQGCDKWLEIARYRKTEACVEALRRSGFRLYAAVPGAKAALGDLDPVQPAAFLIGNEHAGLTPAARAACDGAFTIPMHGFSQSLNLSVATALAVHGHAARRRAALRRDGDLDEAQLLRLRARYYVRDVRGAAGIVRRHLRGS